MKISIVGPGLMPIPPKGWGAVECLIWDMANALKDLGQEVQIINTTDFNPKLADYLGEWTHEYKLQHVTDYGNMMLLSDGENGTP